MSSELIFDSKQDLFNNKQEFPRKEKGVVPFEAGEVKSSHSRNLSVLLIIHLLGLPCLL